jgi:hypothetical protein
MLRRPEPRKSSYPPRSFIASDQETKAPSNKRITTGCSCNSTDENITKPLRHTPPSPPEPAGEVASVEELMAWITIHRHCLRRATTCQRRGGMTAGGHAVGVGHEEPATTIHLWSFLRWVTLADRRGFISRHVIRVYSVI